MNTYAPDLPTAREDFARFLSACYYEPSPMLVEEGVFDAMAIAGAAISPELGECARKLGAAFAANEIDSLLVEYTRLFLGPVDAPAKPYGCVWLSRETTLMQDSTMAVERLYESGGFEISEEFQDLPDHMAVELEFLYGLNFKSRRAVADDPIHAVRMEFLRDHLGKWVGPFTMALETSAQSPFYVQLAVATRCYVASEIRS